MKAATSWAQMGLYTWGISIHAAREGGDPQKAACKDISHISIHAAREGGDSEDI